MGQEKPEYDDVINKLWRLVHKLGYPAYRALRWKISPTASRRLQWLYYCDLTLWPNPGIDLEPITFIFGIPVDEDPTVPDGYVILCADDGSEGSAYIEPYSWAESYMR